MCNLKKNYKIAEMLDSSTERDFNDSKHAVTTFLPIITIKFMNISESYINKRI